MEDFFLKEIVAISNSLKKMYGGIWGLSIISKKNRVILVEFWALFRTICILSKCRNLSIKSKVDRGLIYDSGDV
jgi:hypothetical protein